MTVDLIPTPGWLAMNLHKLGHELAMALLGAGLIIASDQAQQTPEAWYARLAAADEPGFDLQQFYAELEETHEWLRGHLEPLTGWMLDAPPQRYERVRTAASLLARVDFLACSAAAGGELLGQVYNEIVAITRRWEEPLNYVTLQQARYDALGNAELLEEGKGILDGWCATGVRVLGMIAAMRELGRDPAKCGWYLQDPDPFALSLAGLNMVAAHVGEKVILKVARGIFHAPHDPRHIVALDDDALDSFYEAPEGVLGPDYMVAVENAQLMAAAIAIGQRHDDDVDAVTAVLQGAVRSAVDLRTFTD